MKYLYKIVLMSMLFVLVTFTSKASHIVGGDIAYRCLGGNNFEINIVIYYDCTNAESVNAANSDDTIFFAIYEGRHDGPGGLGSLKENLILKQEQFSVVPPNFANECISNPPVVCLRKTVYRTVVKLPPNVQGYTLLYQRCCRNKSVLNILQPGATGTTMFSYIPSFANNACPNNSAVFKNFPPQIVCKDNPISYDFSATDADGDSLVYRLCEAYPGASQANPKPDGLNMFFPGNSVNYVAPFSALLPIPSLPTFNINPVTGLLTGVPTQSGRFILTICVDEYKNGVFKNTNSRDIQLTITDCSKNVIANMPTYPGFDNTYIIECRSYTVKFVNTSTGGFSYLWDFGVGGATSTDFEPTFTYPDTGTYLVKLIVNPGTTCVDSIVKKVMVYPYHKASFTFSGRLCPDSPIVFKATSSNTFGETVSWNWNIQGNEFSDSVVSYAFPPPGGPQDVYIVTSSSIGCRDTFKNTVPITYLDTDAGRDTVLVINHPYQLQGSGATYYQWSPSHNLNDATNPNAIVSFSAPGEYTFILTGTNEEGCASVDTVVIQVVKEKQMFLPNAFSPNGDGLNDVFRPRIVGYSLVNIFQVYNRWGELVYTSTNNNDAGWDGTQRGKKCDVGVYFYRIVCVDPLSNKKVEAKGDVTLLR